MALTTAFTASTLAGSILAGALAPRAASRGSALALKGALVVVASLLLVMSAKLSVPFWPVPMTMQSFAVIAIGAALGPRLGVAAVALYVGYGLFGYPVFANTPPAFAGPAYLLGPTGGFILGFFAAAAIAGWAAERGASALRVILGLVLTHVVILGLGFLWLGLGAQMASGATGIGLETAFAKGVAPFILGSFVKVALAAALVFASWNWVSKRG
jgi:biotin transport system substrate-specific component